MCGIFAILSGVQGLFDSFQPFTCNCTHFTQVKQQWKDATRDFLQRRGPDSFRIKCYSLYFQRSLELQAAVLSLRGNRVVEQPLEDSFEENDTLVLSKLLGQLVFRHRNSGRDNNWKPLYSDILELLDSLPGPWSIIYYISSLRCLIFGRDVIGRRSLLLGKTGDDQSIFISSVSPQEAACSGCLIELAPLGLYCIEWEEDNPFGRLDCHFRDVRKRNISTSSLLSCRLPRGAPQHALFLDSYLPDKWWRTQEISVHSLDDTSNFVLAWINVLLRAVGRRIEMLQLPSQSSSNRCGSLPFALLFSGGIDSLVLAYLIWKVCQSHEIYQYKTLELINVCFGPPSKSPDRKTAMEGIEELNRICSNHKLKMPFRLLFVDVDKEEYQKYRQHLKYLLFPCCTPMDISIGSTLWFGARAQGHVKESNDVHSNPYTSSSKVLLSGLGADELLGGYKGRHRSVFQRGGYSTLAYELNMDLSRLWWRNLGRDDRIVGDHGKELRLPFLDEQVIDFITSLPLQVICDMELPDGIGDKRILRQAAKQLGFSNDFVSRKKRAMQFGMLNTLCWIVAAQLQLPYLLPADPLYSFRSPLSPPVIPGEVLRNWFGVGQTKLAQKDGVDIVRLTDMEQDAFGTLYHITPLKQQHFNLSFVYWIGTKEIQPRVDSLAFWYTKHPPTYGTVYGNEAAFQGLGIVIQLFDNQWHRPSLFPVVNERTTKGSDWQVKVLSPGCALGSLTGKIYVSYQQGKLSVYQLPIQKNTLPNPEFCFDVQLPPSAQLDSGYFGFTAKSGNYATEHSIIQVTVATGAVTTAAKNTADRNKKQPDPFDKASKKSVVDGQKTSSVLSPPKPVASSSKPKPATQSNSMLNAVPSQRDPQTPANVQGVKTDSTAQQEGNQQMQMNHEGPQDSMNSNPNMEYLKSIWDDTHEKQQDLSAKLTQLLVEWETMKRSTSITMIFAIALVVLLQFYACMLYLYYRKLASRLRYNKII
ncbi:Asparagine synthetase domain-containing protein 1 [Galdieria sulphuraria]|nr:Asparagine synthetase domain-containing protein 1 [Galdieria sulphuraria]